MGYIKQALATPYKDAKFLQILTKLMINGLQLVLFIAMWFVFISIIIGLVCVACLLGNSSQDIIPEYKPTYRPNTIRYTKFTRYK